MSNIKKKESEIPTPTIYSKIGEDDAISIGDIIIDREGGEIFRIFSCDNDEKYPHYNYEYLANTSPIEWKLSERTLSANTIREYYKKIDSGLFTEGHELYKKYINSNYDLSAFDVDSSIDDSTAIVAISSKEYLEQMQDVAMLQAKRVEAIRMFVTHQMIAAKQHAEALRRTLEAKLAVFKKQIKKIYKVIQTIELYLGISEDLVQIQEGMPASADTPISFRQAILFMDEEVAVWEDGGLDYSNIDIFEKWLTTDKNYEKCIPEQKGMVVFKPRRLQKYYSENRVEDAIRNSWNKTTYFLIRNGENIYRISSSNIAISKRLFPKREELASMLKSVDEETWEHRKEEAKEKFDDTFDQYRCMAFLMQGLIDRTEIFTPLPFKINIFNLEEAGDAVQFIYDDELALPSGRLPFIEWQRDINNKIKAGSRILLTGYYGSSSGYVKSSDYGDRWAKYYHEYSFPKLPQKNIYEVNVRYKDVIDELPHYEIERLHKEGLLISIEPELIARFTEGYPSHWNNIQPEEGYAVEYFTHERDGKMEKYVKAYKCKYKHEELFIKYNPLDRVTHGWDDFEERTRKNNLSWVIEKTDKFVLNYDHISLEDIDLYIHSRTDRQHYYDLMPLLKSIKEKLLSEMENEKNFIKLMVGRIISAQIPNVSEEKAQSFVEELIVWWKFRTQQKRPISKDDTLAMRMIERRLMAAVNRKKLINKD